MIFNHKYNILILGSNGMLGYDVFTKLKKMSEFYGSRIGNVIGLDVKDGYDFTEPHTLGAYFQQSIKFDYCINCIAHTDTFSAENTKDGFVESYKLNSLLPKYIAESCNYHKVKLIHISTDYVFSEYSRASAWGTENTPVFLSEDSEQFPVNVYGMHKLLGEQFIKEKFRNNIKNYAILRTSWLYGAHNRKSFVHKFMRNVKKCLDEGKCIEVTGNEYSIPTSTEYVFRCILDVIDNKRYGILNAVCASPRNNISRFDFARKILDSFPPSSRICDKNIRDVEIQSVSRETFQPKYSTMRSSFDTSNDWTFFVEQFIDENVNDILDYISKPQ